MGSRELTGCTWKHDEIQCPLPPTGPGSNGDVVVEVAGRARPLPEEQRPPAHGVGRRAEVPLDGRLRQHGLEDRRQRDPAIPGGRRRLPAEAARDAAAPPARHVAHEGLVAPPDRFGRPYGRLHAHPQRDGLLPGGDQPAPPAYSLVQALKVDALHTPSRGHRPGASARSRHSPSWTRSPEDRTARAPFRSRPRSGSSAARSTSRCRTQTGGTQVAASHGHPADVRRPVPHSRDEVHRHRDGRHADDRVDGRGPGAGGQDRPGPVEVLGLHPIETASR